MPPANLYTQFNLTTLTWSGQVISHAALQSHLKNLILKLSEMNLKAGDRVAYYGKNHPVALLLPFACSHLDLTYVPCSSLHSVEKMTSLIRNLEVAVLVSEEEFFFSSATRWVDPDELWTGEETGRALPPPSEAKHARLIFSTSGTTGEPKPVSLFEDHLLQNLRAAMAGQALATSDRVLATLSICHSGGLCIQALPSILAGAHLILLEEFSVPAFYLALNNDRPTVTLTVPNHLRLLKFSSGWNVPRMASLRLIGIGSAPLPRELARECAEDGLKLMNIYGLTEAGPFAITGWVTRENVRDHSPIGRPAEGISVKLTNGDHGEIWLRGKAVQPNGEFVGEWFPTGDLGVLAGDNYFMTGRIKEIINVGGMKVNPVEIEDVLLKHPGVGACAVISREHKVFGEILVACVEPAPGAKLSKLDLLKFCRLHLSRHLTPRDFRIFEALPRSAVGKIMKSVLEIA